MAAMPTDGRGRLVAGAATIGLALACALAPLDPHTVERWFSVLLYPAVQRRLTPLANLVPFAWLDLLGAAALAGCIVAVTRAVVVARRTRRVRPLVVLAWRLAVAGCIVYLLFLGIWGFNYRRVPMRERLVLSAQMPSDEDVARLGADAVAAMNRLHDESHRIGWSLREWEDRGLVGAFRGVHRALVDAPPPVPGRLKASLLGRYFRWTSIDGMVDPFALEVLANPDLRPFERPFVAAHEWAHLAGFADESEASFVAFLTCVRGPVPAAYSGWLALYWQVSAELAEPVRTRLRASLTPGVRADLDAVAARVAAGRLPALELASWRVYDRYLKANRVASGVRSYGEVVTLLLRARFDGGWTPVRKPLRP